MKFYVIRGYTVAELEISRPRQAFYIDPLDIIPREILQQADFVFQIVENGMIKFLKKRSPGKHKNFFDLKLALNHIEVYYREYSFLDYKIEGFEIWDFTDLNSIAEKRDLVHDCVTKLRNGK